MRGSRRSGVPLITGLLLAAFCGSAGAAAKNDTGGAGGNSTARAVAEKVTAGILEILRDPKLTRLEKRQKVEDLAYQSMDFETMARLTLGRNWRDLSDAQRVEFVQEFKKHLSATYGHTTDEYTDEDINVTGDRLEANGDCTVQSRVIGTKDKVRQEIAKVDYRLRQKDGQWKIIDVTIEGVSLVANFRAQFQEIMSNGGIDKLLKMLREKNAAVDAK